jgi:P4 family phage/plasmid primase-like protien
MIQIPIKLQQRGIRFVLLERSGKKPFQKDWQNKNIEYDNLELLNHLKGGGNYGVLGGGQRQLIILDFDNELVQEQVCKMLPKTFTVKTGSGKLHKYFISDKCGSFKIFSENMDTLADIQGEGKQVVGAGSIHPNGNIYEVVDDSEINYLPYAELKAIMMQHDKKPKKEEKVYEKPRVELEDNFLDELKRQLSMKEVLSSFGIDTSKNPTECYFHSSNGGKCLGFNNETAHCFHCDGSWNIFSFVKDAKNCSFKEALEYLANLSGLQNELEKSRERYLEKIRETQVDEKRDLKENFLDLIKEKKTADASEIIVKYILKKNYIYTTRDDNKSEVWIYKEGIYVPDGKSEVKEIMRDVLGKWYCAYFYNLVINKLEPDTFIDSKNFFGNNYVYEIPVENGILNILTRELHEFSPEKIFFNKLPVKYNALADCPKIEQFLKEILAKEEDIDVFYEIVGYCLLKEMKFEKAFMFIGDGRNGKDKSLELIKRIIGIENCCSVPLSSLLPESFIISEFFGKMVNIAGEISNNDLKETNCFKQLTGRSLVSAPRKFLNPITFVNHAKFIFACNELPMVYDNSRGFWDRWVLLEFPFTFVNKEELKKENGENLKLRDENIIEKITQPSELSGLLNKGLDALDRLLVQKDFSTTLGSKEIKDLWIRKSNSVMAFCLDFITEEYDSYITKKEFRKKYSEFCKKHQIKSKSDYVIKRTLEEMFGVSEENKEVLGRWDKVWGGIKWK